MVISTVLTRALGIKHPLIQVQTTLLMMRAGTHAVVQNSHRGSA